jgi:precorrin-6x reductase
MPLAHASFAEFEERRVEVILDTLHPFDAVIEDTCDEACRALL